MATANAPLYLGRQQSNYGMSMPKLQRLHAAAHVAK
ncbi:hypothetical protein PC128_g2857 [Phytophthora cactorum]|nr:hypothetical protein PC128_g2857 [Phytophthora cactorum]